MQHLGAALAEVADVGVPSSSRTLPSAPGSTCRSPCWRGCCPTPGGPVGVNVEPPDPVDKIDRLRREVGPDVPVLGGLHVVDELSAGATATMPGPAFVEVFPAIAALQILLLSSLNMGGSLTFEAETYIPALYIGLQKPLSRGRVTLSNPDPGSAPEIELNFLSDDAGVDRTRMVDGIRRAMDLMGTEACRRPARAAGTSIQRSPARRKPSIPIWTPACPPATTSVEQRGWGQWATPMAVVDEQFRVHGIDNLRIVDASVMPDIVRAHPNLTIIMMGERAADMIRTQNPV